MLHMSDGYELVLVDRSRTDRVLIGMLSTVRMCS